jgi:hypothetical protein
MSRRNVSMPWQLFIKFVFRGSMGNLLCITIEPFLIISNIIQ